MGSTVSGAGGLVSETCVAGEADSTGAPPKLSVLWASGTVKLRWGNGVPHIPQ